MAEPTIPCSEAVEQLWGYLDQELGTEDRAGIEHHLALCRRCCGELEFAKELRAFLSSHSVDDVPPDVRSRLERFVDEVGG